MNTKTAKTRILAGEFDAALSRLYGDARVPAQRIRYANAVASFEQLYGDKDVAFFSVPGRTEIIGNHTDHNNGRVIAASVDIDIIAVAAKTDDNTVRVKSEGYREDVVQLCDLDPDSYKNGSSAAILAGVASAFRNNGRNCGSFAAYTTSDVLTGSGLSSSAAFEVMIGCIQSHFYNNGIVSAVELAKAGQYAENVFFGKPCGLMDQTACALGGFAYIDFKDTSSPVVEKFELDLASKGYALCIINTGGNHADLTGDYAAVPAEMKSVAEVLGARTLRFADETKFRSSLPALREKCGDRAILRAFHFFEENRRVLAMRSAISEDNIAKFLETSALSGDSSFKYLQNVYTVHNVSEQGLSLALAICQSLGVTSRVHGGGFAGTVQAFPRLDMRDALKAAIEPVFGKGSCMFLGVRADGAVMVDIK